MSTNAYRFLERKELHKASQRAVAAALRDPPPQFDKQRRFLINHSRRVALCALTEHVATYRNQFGQLVLIVTNRRACATRECVACEARRARRLVREARAMLRYLNGKHPTARAIFLTVTERSAPQGQLATILRAHIAGVKALFQKPRVKCAILGHYSAVEIAPRLDANGSPTFGVHSHHLLLVPESYWASKYIPQREWVRLFREARKLSYNPICDVRIVRSPVTDGPAFAAEHAATELLKYFVKTSAFIHHEDGRITVDATVVAELAVALKHRRMHRLGGVFIEARKVIRSMVQAMDDDCDDPTSPPAPPFPAQRLRYSRT